MATTVRTSLGTNSWVIEYAPSYTPAELLAHIKLCMADGGWTFEEESGNSHHFSCASHTGVAKYRNGIELSFTDAGAINFYATEYTDGVRNTTSYRQTGNTLSMDVTAGGHFYMFVSPYWVYYEHNGNDSAREAGTMFVEHARDCGTVPNDMDSHRWGKIATNFAANVDLSSFTSTGSMEDAEKLNYTGGGVFTKQQCFTRAYTWGDMRYPTNYPSSTTFGTGNRAVGLDSTNTKIEEGHALYNVALEIGITAHDNTWRRARFMGRPIGLKLLHRGDVTNLTPIKTDSIGLLDPNGADRDHFIFQTSTTGFALALPL